MNDCDDAELMSRYADGDTRAFETLYGRHKDSLYRYLLRHTRNPAAAEDVAQDVWTKLIAARRRYRPDAKFTTFLYRIAHNAWIDSGRRNRIGVVHEAFDDRQRPAPERSAAEQLDDARLKRLFLNALSQLPDDQRDAWLLHEEAGLSINEVAQVTGTLPETAKSRIRYAVRKLKDALLDAQLTEELRQ